jgi:hypothetical protein
MRKSKGLLKNISNFNDILDDSEVIFSNRFHIPQVG